MIVELHASWPEIQQSHRVFLSEKLRQEVASEGERNLRSERGLRLAVRNLVKTVREETREGKEFLDYVVPPNDRGEFEAILRTRMSIESIQTFWCEDTFDEETKDWLPELRFGTPSDCDLYRMVAVVYSNFNDDDAFLSLRMLVRLRS